MSLSKKAMNKWMWKSARFLWEYKRHFFHRMCPTMLSWFPLGLQIEITTKCNLRCMMCPNRGFSDFRMTEMSMDTYLRALDQSLPELEYVYMWGVGEPTSHPKFLEMVRIAKQKGLKVSFSTNGTFMNERMVKQIVQLGVDEVIFSIDSADPELFEEIRRGAKFGKVIRNLETLLRMRGVKKIPSVSITCSLMKLNLNGMPRLVELAHKLGVQKVWFQNIISWDHFTESQSLLGVKNKKEIFRIFDETKRVARDKGVWIRLPEFEVKGNSVCVFPWFGPMNVRWDGSVTLCPWIAYPTHMYYVKRENKVVKQHRMFNPWVMGNLYQQPLKLIWNNAEYQKMRLSLKKNRQPDPCNMCLHQFQVIC